jgi:hypothetical protein
VTFGDEVNDADGGSDGDGRKCGVMVMSPGS